MKVQHTDLKLTSEHQLQQESTIQFQLSADMAALFSKQLNEQISAMSLPTPSAPPPKAVEMETVQQEKAKRFQSLMELLFGENKTGSTPCSPPPVIQDAKLTTAAPVKMTQLQVFAVEQLRESEQCSFAANGKVCLADGSTRQFAVDYQLSRQTETTRALGAQWMNLQDPLVLDFGAPTALLSDKTVEFDLDCDGKKELMTMPSSSSAWLFLDRNRNGRADDGSELFGPKTGQGFTELAALDEDHNGWIDEGDAAFKDLRLWQQLDTGVEGDGVRSLSQAGVGALAVVSAKTEFSIVQQGDVLGQIRASSVWLGEHSGAGVLRQIDVGTKPI
ncbi:hypothetical protein [Deefgea rivuli]|uniref:hypothetical protein n=1 Tax=Deefgea rivuli TaxID=400948 RepID=UPI0006881EAF|nr:hypothetical protein [Deefgea rivuli]